MTDVETHQGDEVLWVLEGNVQIRAWKDAEEGSPIFKPCHSLRTHDRFLIPEGYHHEYYNLSDGMAKILFAVGPKL